jgi:roadblock/LC7 domain-containing protein
MQDGRRSVPQSPPPDAGVVLFGSIDDQGRVVVDEGALPSDARAPLGQLIASVEMTMGTYAKIYGEVVSEPWDPMEGWCYAGGRFAICVWMRRFAIVERERGDPSTALRWLADLAG